VFALLVSHHVVTALDLPPSASIVMALWEDRLSLIVLVMMSAHNSMQITST
jgi:hypothetical protein